jgi:hypothetical protein
MRKGFENELIYKVVNEVVSWIIDQTVKP